MPEELQGGRLLARVLRLQVQGVRGLRHVVHEDRREPGRGKRSDLNELFAKSPSWWILTANAGGGTSVTSLRPYTALRSKSFRAYRLVLSAPYLGYVVGRIYETSGERFALRLETNLMTQNSVFTLPV